MAVALSRAASPLDVVPFPTTAAVARREESEIELSVVVPTFNERSNVPELIRRLDACLRHVAWEVIVVDDDSPDGTAEVVREIARRDRRVRCLHRLGRRGLASACIEGMLAGSGSYFAVLDGDLQHDETLLARMLDELRDGETDVVIGSRYLPGGGTGDAWDQRRAAISGLGARLGRLVLKASLSDPMSGFFMIRRGAFEEVVHRLSGLGFKILLDLFASSARPLRFKELPYRFRSRQAGESKLDGRVVWEYLMMLADKAFGHVVPARFVAFVLVGGSGRRFRPRRPPAGPGGTVRGHATRFHQQPVGRDARRHDEQLRAEQRPDLPGHAPHRMALAPRLGGVHAGVRRRRAGQRRYRLVPVHGGGVLAPVGARRDRGRRGVELRGDLRLYLEATVVIAPGRPQGEDRRAGGPVVTVVGRTRGGGDRPRADRLREALAERLAETHVVGRASPTDAAFRTAGELDRRPGYTLSPPSITSTLPVM
jgi:glycosyltransferase involved in cell wall biosynthesis